MYPSNTREEAELAFISLAMEAMIQFYERCEILFVNMVVPSYPYIPRCPMDG
jgi:hypothetical protein